MGLPNINIVFKTKGVTAIKRSERGIVALVIKDDTEGGKPMEVFKSVTDIDFTKFTKRNYEYLKLIYEGAPSKVVVIRLGTSSTDYTAALTQLANLKWNYLTIPSIDTENLTFVSAWIKEQRAKQKTFKAILPKCVADHEGIINFTTDEIESTLSETKFSTAEYCARIAGVLAGLPLSRSATYFVFPDIISAAVPDDPDERIDKGELIITFDSENYKIGRGVNSLTTFTTEHGEEFSKIKIMEGVDLYNDDIRSTFEDYYIGKYRNDYDNKQAFVAAVNAYNKALEGDVLDRSYDNKTSIDVEAQRQYLEGKGIDTSAMDDVAVAMANTGARVFVAGNIKFVDAMEDLDMVNHM